MSKTLRDAARAMVDAARTETKTWPEYERNVTAAADALELALAAEQAQPDETLRPVAWMAMRYGVPAQATTDEPTAIRWRKAGGDVRSLVYADAPPPALVAQPAAQQPAKGEAVAWLIERGQAQQQSPTSWWTGSDWVTDANQAQRFPTREAAAYAARGMRPLSYVLTQHMWVDAAAQQTQGEAAGNIRHDVTQACPFCNADSYHLCGHLVTAQQAAVPLKVRWAPADMSGGDSWADMREKIRRHPLYDIGDTILVWVNEGDIHLLGERVPQPPKETQG